MGDRKRPVIPDASTSPLLGSLGAGPTGKGKAKRPPLATGAVTLIPAMAAIDMTDRARGAISAVGSGQRARVGHKPTQRRGTVREG